MDVVQLFLRRNMDWDHIVLAINQIIDEIRKKQVLQNVAIRDDIFSILEKNCTVLYYPLEGEKNRGFHVKRIVKDKLEDFVYINTDKPIDEQIFAAAHEFGHIFDVAKRVCGIIGMEYPVDNKLEEDITDRFAAELLMPKEAVIDMCVSHIKDLKIDTSSVKFDQLVKLIVLLMNDFMVPYETVRKRLKEVEVIDEKTSNDIAIEREDVSILVDNFTRDQNSYIGKGTRIKTIPGIRSMIERAEKNYTENEYLLAKIRNEFEIKDMPETDRLMKISLGESVNE